MGLQKNRFEEALEQLKSEYETVVAANKYLRQQLEDFNKDEEIKKLKVTINEGYFIPAYAYKDMKKAAQEHEHNNCVYIITPTSLDDCVECKCETCGKILYHWWI